MASSSSNPSSTSPSSSTTSAPSTTAAPPPAYAPGAIASTYATALNLGPSATAPGIAPGAMSSGWGGRHRTVPKPTIVDRGQNQQSGTGDRARHSGAVSQPGNSGEWATGFQTAAAPTSPRFAPLRSSTTEGSSSSTVARTRRLPYVSTAASTPTDTGPASATSSSATSSTFASPRRSSEGSSSSTPAWSKDDSKRPSWLPRIPRDTRPGPGSATSPSTTASPDITLLTNASGSASAVAASARTTQESNALISVASSAPGVQTIVFGTIDPASLTSSTSSAPGVTTSATTSTTPSAPVMATIPTAPTTTGPGVPTFASPSITGPGVSTPAASTPSPAPAVTTPAPATATAPTAAAMSFAPSAGPAIPAQQAFGGNGMPAYQPLYSNPVWVWARFQWPWDCRHRPARFVVTPCGHRLAICDLCRAWTSAYPC